MKRIILWGAWYGSENIGDQALLLSITDLLGGEIEKVEFIVITDNPSNLLAYTARASAHTFLPLYTRKQFFEIIKAFMKADVFIFGGGVPFYDETFHSIVIAVLVTLSRIFRVPCVLWSVSSQRIKSVFTRLVLRYLLSYSSVVTCRDRHTRQLLRECGRNDVSQQMAADSVFTLRSNGKRSAKELLERAEWSSRVSRPLVALTPRTLRGNDGEAHTHYSPALFSDSQKEIEVFSAVVDWLWEHGYQPIFVPMNTVAPDDDRLAFHEIIGKAKFGSFALLVDEQIYPRDAANVYSYCEAAFVARVHGAVMAFLGRCPVLMYAFDLKHGGIMEQMGFARQIFDPAMDSPEVAIEMMENMLRSRVELIAQIEKKAGELQKQARVPLEAVLRLLHR